VVAALKLSRAAMTVPNIAPIGLASAAMAKPAEHRRLPFEAEDHPI
jgi:hypothetical protein